MNINISELQRLKSRNDDVNAELQESFVSMKKTLSDICDNVRSSSLTGATQNLVEAINEVAASISAALPNISAFLGTQMSKYSASNQEAKQSLDDLIVTIDSNF